MLVNWEYFSILSKCIYARMHRSICHHYIAAYVVVCSYIYLGVFDDIHNDIYVATSTG